MRWRFAIFGLLLSCSAHRPEIHFVGDDADTSEVWVCLPKLDKLWCVSFERFQAARAQQEHEGAGDTLDQGPAERYDL